MDWNSSEKGKKYQKRYVKENFEKVKKYKEKYVKNNPEKIKNSKKIYKDKNPWRSSFDQAKRRCTNPKAKDYHRYGGRGIKFLMSINDFKELWFRDKAYNMDQPSIDRINNDGDYEYNNCQFIEMLENIVKTKLKPVNQYDIDGNYIKTYSSMTIASNSVGLKSNGGICACCMKKQNTAGGYMWKYNKEQQGGK